MYQFYGLTRIEETAAYTLWSRHLHPEDRASAEQTFQDALSGLRPLDTRFRIIWGDGTVRHLRATGRVTRDNEGRALRIVGVNWDISKVRELSLELERKEQMLRSVTDSLPMLVSYIDTEQRYRFANPTYAAWFGVPIENIVGRRVADILDASTWAKSAPHLQAALQGTASVYENQLRVLGQQRELRAQFMPQWDEHGQVEGVVGVVSDITEYKANEQRLAQAVAQATETLRQEEARWRNFSTIASDWFWETDAQHSYRFVSDNFEQFFGLPASHLVGKNLKSLLENDSLNIPELTAQHVLKLDGRQPWRQFEYQVRIADGSIRCISMSASPQFDTDGRFTGYRGNGSCITDRKNVEKKTAMLVDEINMLNQRFRLAKDAARIGVWDYKFADNTLIWNKWMYAHYAVREEDFGATFQAWLARLHPGDAARVDAEMAQAVRGEKDFDTEFRVVWPTGEIRHIKAAALVQRDGRGAALKMVGVNYDITAIRLAEQAALRDQGLDLATVQRIGRIGTFVANLETEMWTSSSVLDEIFGIDANFVRSENNWSTLVAPEFTQAIDDYFLQVVSEKGSYDKKYEIVRPADGQRRWVHAMGEITFDAEGKPLRFKGTVQDITERKLAQAHLRLLEASISHLNDMVVITEAEPLDEPGPRIVFVNAAFERHTGYSGAEVLGRSPRFLQGPLTQRLALDRISAALKVWQPVRAELINYTKGGQPFWGELDMAPIADATGVFTHWVCVERDITERKRAEQALTAVAAENTRLLQEVNQLNVGLDRQIAERTEALARQEALFHALADQAPQVIWMLDLTGNVTYINQAWLDLVGGTLQDWTGGQWIAAIYPEDWASLRAIWLLAQAGGQPFSGIRRVLCQDGSVHTMSYRGTPVRDERGVVIFWVGIDSDVTELKLIETALRERNQELASSERALRELASRQMAIKEVERRRIAQEIHDELGQRLTVLRMDVAMLPRAVQASGGLPVPLSVALLKDQIDDILAVVRDLAGKLRPAAIDLGLSVAAEALIENFQASLGIPCTLSDQLPAGLALDEPRTLGAFRILQESLTNVARHAQANSIHITLALADDQLFLRVRDDGRGFAASAQLGQPGFGLPGMRERATALGGRVDVASRPGHGTTVEARFPLHCPLQSAIVLPPGYDPLDLVPLL
ncbi:MAG: PAS domain S-box protein [Polaromonas sp.]|nr:PAS domain S-box protein [Polaromonas sp.]